MKKIASIIWSKTTLLVLLVLILFQSQFYRLKTKKEIPQDVKERLISLGEKALENGDVPVAAIILYHDSIIGEGYNMVLQNSDLGNHAEIMALSDVFEKQGNSFGTLKRDELMLYSTFEPCEMCKGAMIHYGIKHIYFEENKSAYSQIKSTLKSLSYNTSINRIDAPGLQEDLFTKHPDYKPD